MDRDLANLSLGEPAFSGNGMYLDTDSNDFHTLANFIPHMVWTAEPSGAIEYLNQRGLEYLGAPLGAVLRFGFHKLIHPQDLQAAQRSWQDSMDRVAAYEAEYRLRRHDGAYRWHVARAMPVLDDAGQIKRWFGTCTDVHDARCAATSLVESEERFRVTFNQAAVGIAHSAIDGTFIRVNDRLCSILGYSREELLQLSFKSITHPEDMMAELKHTRQLLVGGVPHYATERRYIRKDGSLVWVSLTVALVRDRYNEPKFFIGVIQDISARKTTELELEQTRLELERRVEERTAELSMALEQLRQEMAAREKIEVQNEANRAQMIHSAKMSAIGEMAAGFAQEVTSPLSAIRAKALELKQSAAEEKPVSPAEAGEIASGIIATTDQVYRIAAALRGFAHQNDLDEHVEVPVLSIVESTLEFCKQRFAQNGIDLQILVPRGVTVLCRPAQLSQVLLNLLNNCYDAVRQHPVPWVRLEAFEEAGHVAIAVTDSGPGIAPDLLDKIMLPFFSTKEIGHGTGLGLSIARGIVENHGGRLVIDTSSPNTRFLILLPH